MTPWNGFRSRRIFVAVSSRSRHEATGRRSAVVGTRYDQKRIELGYLEAARRASSIFPHGELLPHENPDWLVKDSPLGIEVTELCHHEPRSEGARLDKILPKAKKLFDAHPNAKPIFVNFSLSPRSEDIGHVDEMAAGLARFAIEHVDHYGNFSWDDGIP